MKAYKFKIKPNRKFADNCQQTLNVCRELYNAALQERRDSYALCHKAINYHHQRVQLPEIKELRIDVAAVYSQVTQDVLRRASRTYDAFFQRCLKGEKPGFPRFKAKDRYHSFTYPQSGFRLEGDKLHLSKIGSCRIRQSREVEGKIKTCPIKKQVDGWFVVFAVENAGPSPLPQTGEAVGIDVGIENFATLSTGEVIENPRYLKESEAGIEDSAAQSQQEKAGRQES